MFYVMSRTSGKAQKQLQPRYESTTYMYLYTNHIQMLESLASIFINANHLIDAQEDYNSLQIDFRELFSDFKIRYIYAADEAEVLEGQRFRGIYNKLTLPLKTSVYTQLIRLSRDFEELCLTVAANNTEARRLREQKNKKAVNNTSLIPKYSTSYTPKPFLTTTTPLV